MSEVHKLLMLEAMSRLEPFFLDKIERLRKSRTRVRMTDILRALQK